MNPLLQLQKEGQSVWLDYIRRSLIESGELKQMVEEDGLRGLTSNSQVFMKAIAGSDEYDRQIEELVSANPHIQTSELYEAIAITDIRAAAEVLRPVFDQTACSRKSSMSRPNGRRYPRRTIPSGISSKRRRKATTER